MQRLRFATENGYNLYVCGNGGAKPRHGDLLAADIDEETAIRYIDRVFMYYIFTADKLTRTSVWLEKLEGGLGYLKEVVIDDKLGICDELERRMQHLVDTYKCEWKEIVNDPEKRKLFRQFVNTDEADPGIEFIDERGQRRPADWPKDVAPLHQIKLPSANGNGKANGNGRAPARDLSKTWVRVGTVSDFPENGGATIKYGGVQIAVYNFTSRNEWYACQNMCPHKNAFVLSRGIIGSADETPKVACPMHKKPFSLETGKCLSGEDFSVKVFPVRVVGGGVLLELPPKEQLDALLATELHRITACDAQEAMTCANCV